ncbi:hypothetical protein [Magnetospirillum molischianum]|uniref:Putative DNA polymerase III n=1 Tax=Magnetospirillum molischianum DSM 120 TaxID=1150626 RepID=H8FUB9_MAGML|nr:hypothetical protein [Magnetospirillum molischianum]CCG41957.1 putative DNA polymerase III [Magnetospirillum molischianum DSM 120]
MVDSVLPPTAPTTAASSPVPATVMSPADAETAEAVARLAAAGSTTVDGILAAITGQPRSAAKIALPNGSFLDLKIPPGFSVGPGATLTFQFQPQNDGFVLRLAAVNGRATAGTPAATLAGGGPGGAGLPVPSATTGGGVPSSTGTVTEQNAGISSGRAAGATAPSAGPVLLADGLPGLTATVLRPGRAVPPNGSGGVSPPQSPTAGTAPSVGTAPSLAVAPFTVPSAWTNLAPGTQLHLRFIEARPAADGGIPPERSLPGTNSMPASPGQALAAADARSATAPVILTGRVLTAPIPGGGAQVQTAAGLLSLPAGLSLPVGGMVWLEVVGMPVPPLPAPLPLAPGLGTGGWPALSEAINLLTRDDLQAAEQLIRDLPQAGPRLAAVLMRFAASVRNGDSRLPGGESTQRGLDKIGRHDLAERLRGDLSALSEESTQPRGKTGEWQTLTMPFLNGAQIDPIRLHVQTPPEDEKKRQSGGGEKRFILEVQMSRLGRIQFDGLVLRESKRFDLIVRTHLPLDHTICRDITGIFGDCAQLTGIKGGVSFQSGRPFVELPPSATAATCLMV